MTDQKPTCEACAHPYADHTMPEYDPERRCEVCDDCPGWTAPERIRAAARDFNARVAAVRAATTPATRPSPTPTPRDA